MFLREPTYRQRIRCVAPAARRELSARNALFVAFLALTWTWPAAAQTVVDDPAVDELRQRAPAGANDDRTIDQWLTGLLTKLSAAADPKAAKRDFVEALARVHDDRATNSAFNDALAARLGAIAATELAKGDSLPAHAAEAILQALRAANHPGTIQGLVAALSFPRETVRYFGAAGLQSLRDGIANNQNHTTTVVAAIADAGPKETNAVVVERLYRACSFAGAPAGAIDAISTILEARVNRYRKGATLADFAEPAAFEYLNKARPTQAQSKAIIRSLAVLLRLDVERYAAGTFAPGEKSAIEVRIDACESLMESLCGCTGGNVRDESQTGGAGATIRMQLELDKWIGVEGQSGGVLNNAPWSVPAGAP